jgi:hypothetical protein
VRSSTSDVGMLCSIYSGRRESAACAVRIAFKKSEGALRMTVVSSRVHNFCV